MRIDGSRDGGFILVSVLGVLALMASLAGGSALLVRISFSSVLADTNDLKLDALMTAGIELAAYELFELKRPVARIRDQQVRFDDGTITLQATDEAGLIDLNWSDPVLLAGAYRSAGLSTLAPGAFAARVVAWRERDAEPESRAPPGIVNLAAPRIGRGREGFRTVADLRWLADITEADVEALAPLLTTANLQGRVNAVEAPLSVLMALPEMSPALAAQVMALRANPRPDTRDRIKALLSHQQNLLAASPGNAFRVRIDVRRGGATYRSTQVMLIRAPTRDVPYLVIDQHP